MSPVVTHFISSYLLLPILTVILAVVACIIAKKNQMLNNKKTYFLCFAEWNLIRVTWIDRLP